MLSWVVFGTLLGPEATGPCGGSPFVGVAGWVCLFLVSLPRRPARLFVCGVCGVGLLFENYIVDASILYKKQFPRYLNLDLVRVPFGCAGQFLWFSRVSLFLIFVVKFLRAHGGCLGIRSRRRT